MSRTLFSIILLTLSLSFKPAQAARNFGAGVSLGNPTGLTAKYYLNQKNAIDAAVSWAGSLDFYLHGTYLWLMPTAFNLDRFPVNWYWGIGGRIFDHDHSHHGHWFHNHDDDHDHNDTHFGARAPIGLRMNFNDPLIELYVELSLSLDFAPDMDADLDAGIGARYYF